MKSILWKLIHLSDAFAPAPHCPTVVLIISPGQATPLGDSWKSYVPKYINSASCTEKSSMYVVR